MHRSQTERDLILPLTTEQEVLKMLTYTFKFVEVNSTTTKITIKLDGLHTQ